jgi:hypothetical protein
MPNDPVNNPAHYTAGNIECIDAIKEALGPEQFKGFLRGNVLKYLWRCEHKGNAVQDASKAEWYLKRLLKEIGE